MIRNVEINITCDFIYNLSPPILMTFCRAYQISHNKPIHLYLSSPYNGLRQIFLFVFFIHFPFINRFSIESLFRKHGRKTVPSIYSILMVGGGSKRSCSLISNFRNAKMLYSSFCCSQNSYSTRRWCHFEIFDVFSVVNGPRIWSIGGDWEYQL